MDTPHRLTAEFGRMERMNDVRLRPLERVDLEFVHKLNINANIMSYWFEEPYEAFVELQDLYDKHIHDQGERRFIVRKTKKWWDWLN